MSSAQADGSSSRKTLPLDTVSCSIPCSVTYAYVISVVAAFDAGIATGGSAIKAVEVLMEHGVPEQRIIFINLVCTFLRARIMLMRY